MGVHYPVEKLSPDADDGTMPDNVDALRAAVVGRRTTATDDDGRRLRITLDDGTTVVLADSGDCCAYTELQAFLLHPERIDHIITGVGTTDGYETWHIYADLGDVLELTVGWSCGNPFFYGYGFDITVQRPEPEAAQRVPTGRDVRAEQRRADRRDTS